LFSNLCQEKGCTARKLAETLHVSEAVISRAIALLQLPDAIQKQVNEGTLDARRGYLLSRESDPARQQELAAQAITLSRDELAKRVRVQPPPSASPVRVQRVLCPLPTGVSVSVSGSELGLADLIQTLTDLLKEARKAHEQSLDIKTFSSVLKDKAKKGGEQ
jgi:hypothetical protein